MSEETEVMCTETEVDGKTETVTLIGRVDYSWLKEGWIGFQSDQKQG